MKLVRYSSISSVPSGTDGRLIMTSAQPVHHYGPYVVDDSGFVPLSEAVKRVTGGTLSAQEVKAMYDFPDGCVTSGFRVPLDRRADFHGDIAEVSKAVRDSAKGAQEELADAYREFDMQQKLDAINNNSGDNSNRE